MRTLVTGGAGFIGSSLARALLEEGHEVRILDNFLTGFEENVPEGAELIRRDLRERETFAEACDGVEVVFHQAALRSVPRSVDEPMLALECNVLGTMNILMAASDAGVRRLVYASSSSVYGDTGDAVNVESMPTNPISPYAVSKLAGENYARVWALLGKIETVSLRYFNVFGPGQHPESKYAAVFPAFISALAGGKAPEVHWDGEQSRDFSYVADVVRANILAAEAPVEVGAVLNIGGGGGKTVNEVLRAVSDAIGKWIDPVYQPRRQGDVRHTKADISEAASQLGWKPEAKWEEGVEATVRWFLQRADKGSSAQGSAG